jgi:Protein of unknown function (DUF3100)
MHHRATTIMGAPMTDAAMGSATSKDVTALAANRRWNLGRVILFAALCVLAAESIGAVSMPLGGAYKIVLLPLVWALLIGAVWGAGSLYLPRPIELDTGAQRLAAAALQPALLLFVGKLGLLVGASLPKIMTAGWALMFQEFGHFLGTACFGLPIALLLGIKREAIGATFSVGREPSLAIIGEKFGMDSAEGRGVLAEYITGTVFGAILIAIFAGMLTSLGIFDPLALAMGAGVGSGSMMASASGAIAAQLSPELAKEVAAFAAASNLLTTTIGTYFTLFLSLPFTIMAYRFLEPRIGRGGSDAASAASDSDPASKAGTDNEAHPRFGWPKLLVIWLASGAMALIGNDLGYNTAPDWHVIAGLGIIIATVIVGQFTYTLARGFVPAVVWTSLIAMALTYPGVPFAGEIAALTGKINFLALATPLLAFAGLSIAKDIPAFRNLGWRIVIVSLSANVGTFVGATLIAQFFMHKPV